MKVIIGLYQAVVKIARFLLQNSRFNTSMISIVKTCVIFFTGYTAYKFNTDQVDI